MRTPSPNSSRQILIFGLGLWSGAVGMAAWLMVFGWPLK
ncbi:MAG: hypothetical protein JWP59_3524 [Massilia sp.]|jgi:hypothetical protein|nr:hypothetical protein [Massilia sp.]